MATTLASQVQELYVGYLGRAADKAGLDFWVKAIESGTSTLESVALGFTLSEEYKAQYNGLTTTQLVAKVYQNVLGRAADADGLAFWAGEVNKGVIKAETLVKTMIGSLGAIDQLTIDNKVAAANTYTEAAGANYSVEAGKAAVAGAGVGTVPGVVNPSQTFTLTALQDVVGATGYQIGNGQFVNNGFKFSTANERVIASSATLQGNDSIIDASTADNDVLELALSATLTVPQPTVQNIETLAITASAAAGAVDLTNFSGLKTITVSGTPTAGVDLSDAGTVTDLSTRGVTKVDGSGLTSVAGSLTVSNAAGTANIEITGGAGADTLTGGAGADTIKGGAGADVITGGNGNDKLFGEAGNDRLLGGAGNDELDGGAGNDILDGGVGNDILLGGAGADIIIAGDGNDKVTGGAGNDVIVLGTVGAGAGATALVNGGALDAITYADGRISATDATPGVGTDSTFAARDIVATDFTVNAGETVVGGGATTTARLTTAALGNNTVVFEATAAENGNDTIYGFNAGAIAAVAGRDVLDFSAFLGAAVKLTTASGNDAAANNVEGFNVVTLNTTLAVATTGAESIVFDRSAKYVVLEDTGADVVARLVTTDANGAIVSNDAVVTLVGVANATDFVAENLA